MTKVWLAVVGLAVASRAWNALTMSVLRGFDATGHVAYVLFLDLYHAVPRADQGWSYFHPPLHYMLGWLLAQWGDAQVLVRGLALLASTASLLTAALAAFVVRLMLPGRPGLALLAFAGVAFLPVHVYVSTMPGNEATAALLASAAIAVFLRGKTLGADVATGVLLGLALLSKFSGLLCLLAILASIAWQARAGAARRIAVVAGVAVAVCAPYYARNVADFGTPFQLSRGLPLVSAVESEQAPGERGGLDLLRFPLKTFTDPDPESEHLLHAIPASVYASAWVDARPDVEPPLATTALLLGVVPTLVAALGLGLCLRAAIARRKPIETTVALLALGSLLALAVMAFRVPTFGMLKASYLMGASVAWGVALARGAAALPRAARAIVAGIVALSAVVAVIASAPGVLQPAGTENERMAPVYAHFGHFARAVAILEERVGEAARPERARESLANTQVEAGDYAAAVKTYRGRRRLDAQPPHLEAIDSPWVLGRQAVANALAGDHAMARVLLDAGLRKGPHAPLLVSRAALRLVDGDTSGAEEDLRAALGDEPRNPAAWRVLAGLQAQRGDPDAVGTLARAHRLSLAPPRGFPYGVGDGFHLNAHRFMLTFEDGGLALYRPGRAPARTSPDR